MVTCRWVSCISFAGLVRSVRWGEFFSVVLVTTRRRDGINGRACGDLQTVEGELIAAVRARCNDIYVGFVTPNPTQLGM